MSSSVLYDRLRELISSGLVERAADDAYTLTDRGAALGSALAPLDAWAESWAATLDRDGVPSDR
jgi:DNA-binding HxlR family transcriptional regulator